MRLVLCTVGKPRLEYARLGVREYLGRLKRYTRVEWVHIKEGSPQQEGERLLAASEGMRRVVLDQRGEMANTLALHQKLGGWELQGEKAVAFLMGGASGHVGVLRQEADWLLSLSALTLQHELALVLLVEQLYRVQTIKRGEPYHRG